MGSLALALLLAFISMAAPLMAEQSGAVATRDLRVTDAQGRVTIEPAENPSTPVAVDEDLPLQADDVIVTDAESRAELSMDGETVFRLQPNSRFKVLKIFTKNAQFELSKGGMLAKVKPVPLEDEGIIIKLPTAVVAIRGTEFGADTADGLSTVGVFDEGHVAVAGAWGKEHVKLGPNEETSVPLSNVPHPPKPLIHFRSYRGQMVRVRERHRYWGKHWAPMGPEERKQARDRLSFPIPPQPSKGFRHSAMNAPAAPRINKAKAIMKHQTVKHPARKAKKAKRIHPAQNAHHPKTSIRRPGKPEAGVQ